MRGPLVLLKLRNAEAALQSVSGGRGGGGVYAKKDEAMNTEFGTFRRSHSDENGGGRQGFFFLNPLSSSYRLAFKV